MHPKEIVFGIIGCGQVGKLIINSLIPYAQENFNLLPENVMISTRRPEQLHYYTKKGYKVFFNNEKLMRVCNFLIIAFPPVVDNWNFLELNFYNKAQYTVSLVSTLKLQRLQQLSKLDSRIFNTCINKELLDSSVKNYQEIVESLKPGVFYTQVFEDIAKLIFEDSYKHLFFGERLNSLLDSFGVEKNDKFYQRLFGRSKMEMEQDWDKLVKMVMQRPLLQFSNYASNQNKK